MVASQRGREGGYRLRRPPAEVMLGEVVRSIDGALAPFGDAEQLRELIETDIEHRALYQVFLDVRDAAAAILEKTSLADIIRDDVPKRGTKRREKKTAPARVLSMVTTARQDKKNNP